MKKLIDLIKEGLTIKNIVAAGIGAALWVVVGLIINIPTPVPNTSIQLQYGVQALFALLFGPVPGFLTGFIGHALKDSIQYGSPWWSWVIASGLFGFFIGLFKKQVAIEAGRLTLKDILAFNGLQVFSNIVVWGALAPILDIVVYNEPANKVFTQGLVAGLANIASVALGGTLLLSIYAKSRTKSGSLSKD